MRKDWGFSALVEIAGKRILFDTGDNSDIFAAGEAQECERLSIEILPN
jgi:7,8-dihydropterin-6-yl-methyl-4-(beta-D-ribofuranosyl)aminobenzene 5'-phosphate synthase